MQRQSPSGAGRSISEILGSTLLGPVEPLRERLYLKSPAMVGTKRRMSSLIA